jgi:ferric iron reductase protein FhuF
VTLPPAPQDVVIARLRGAAGLGLVAPHSARTVPVARLADAAVPAALVAERARALGTADLRVAATMWWYSASAVLLAPPLAGLVTGVPLSARPADLVLSVGPGGLPVAATSSALTADLGGELRELLTTVIGAVAGAGGMRERPLWAIATDSLATGLLTLGRVLGDVPAVTGLAGRLAAAVGPELPTPRYEDVAGSRFVRRASCCLIYRLPGGPLCTSCPRRPSAERAALLERAAAGR